LIVLDASAAIEMLLAKPRAALVEQRVFGSGETLHAPQLLEVEVVQVIRRHLLAKLMDRPRAQQAFDDFVALKYKSYEHEVLLKRIWSLRDNFSAYDAAYIALAEAIGATLVTCDGKLNTRGHSARVEVI
jgi:predicted nucleic acid-binding protein